MSSKGYGFESEIEDFFLSFTGQNKSTPLLKYGASGMIGINRSFRVPNSGAMKSLKGDIITAIPWLLQQFKVECKARYESTKKDGPMIIVEKDWISKNEEEANVDNQMPILTFSFKRAQKGRIWWMLRETDYINLCDYAGIKTLAATYILLPQESKKGDKLKFVHRKLVPTLVGNYRDKYLQDCYYLLSHKLFRELMTRLKEK